MPLLKRSQSEAEPALRATAVVVLYEMKPADSPALQSILMARNALASKRGFIHVIVQDHSRAACASHELPPGIHYFHDASNPGVAPAYNSGLRRARALESEWLITLDQDTRVPLDYLARMAETAQECAGHPGIGAIVPQIALGAKRLSPHRLVLGALPRWFETGFRGIPDAPVYAFNSGAMVHMATLQQIGGYDAEFPLEYSDTAMFHRLHAYGKKVYIDGRIQLEHDFSLINMNRKIGPARYRNTLQAETEFWDRHMNWLAGWERGVRLLMRLAKQLVRRDDPQLRSITWEFLRLRLAEPKRKRVQHWLQQRAQEAEAARDATHSAGLRPTVSVCMAAYNARSYVEAQLESILPQLLPHDELVIVDDCSTDGTYEFLAGLKDPRIRVYRHRQNQGVLSTFEDALRLAKGEFLFLCDDDDIWAGAKVEKIVQVFEAQPDARIVTTRVALIDEQGAALPDNTVNRFGTFAAGFWSNVLKNHYQGSAMALRAPLLGQVLPFPRPAHFLHDVWIGTRCELIGGKTVFLNEPLVFYRRHGHNFSRRLSLLERLRVRIELLLSHLSVALQLRAY